MSAMAARPSPPPATRAPRTIDAVVCSHNDAKFDKVWRTLKDALFPFGLRRIIRVSDAKSMAEGYNRGAARGHGDWVIFCRDDVRILHVEPDTLATALEDSDVFGVCGTTLLRGADWHESETSHMFGSVFQPALGQSGRFEHQIHGVGGPLIHGAQALDGVFVACRRRVWEKLRFSEDLTGFTLHDVDFCYRAYLNRYRVCVVTDLLLLCDDNSALSSIDTMEQRLQTRAHVNHKFNFRPRNAEHAKHVAVPYHEIPSPSELRSLARRIARRSSLARLAPGSSV